MHRYTFKYREEKSTHRDRKFGEKKTFACSFEFKERNDCAHHDIATHVTRIRVKAQ